MRIRAVQIASATPAKSSASSVTTRTARASVDMRTRNDSAGGRLLRNLARTEAMQTIIATPLGPSIEEMDDDALLADFRARGSTVFHPVGTCRMGVSPRDSVVDASLKVHGVAGLRVVDASIFPSITSGNTNAPTIMVGYKASEIILRDAMDGR